VALSLIKEKSKETCYHHLSIPDGMSIACDDIDANENKSFEDEIKCWEKFFDLLFVEKSLN
jgi:hypothetical protein